MHRLNLIYSNYSLNAVFICFWQNLLLFYLYIYYTFIQIKRFGNSNVHYNVYVLLCIIYSLLRHIQQLSRPLLFQIQWQTPLVPPAPLRTLFNSSWRAFGGILSPGSFHFDLLYITITCWHFRYLNPSFWTLPKPTDPSRVIDNLPFLYIWSLGDG